MPVNYNDTLGAVFLGAMFTALFYGTMCLQCFHFFRHSERVGYAIFTSVCGLWLLDTMHLAFTAESVYIWTVRDFGNDALIMRVPWTMAVSSLLSTCITTIVQCWYCHRLWILSEKNRLLTLPLFGVICLSTGFGLASNGKSFNMHDLSNYTNTHWITYLNLGLTAFADICITIALCYYLYQHRTPLSHHETYEIVTTLLTYTINTGLLTSLIAIVTLITNATMPDNYVFVATYVLQGEIYSNSLIASFNACDKFRAKPKVPAPMSTLRFAHDTTRAVDEEDTESVTAYEQSVDKAEGKEL